MSVLAGLAPPERAMLAELGFDEQDFEQLASSFRAGSRPSNVVQGELRPPGPGDVQVLAPKGSKQGDALIDTGRMMLHQGKAALLLLNGGMATRFGGQVKGVVEALPGRSFLRLQAERARALGIEFGAALPLVLMNSHATERATREHLDEAGGFGIPERIRLFRQRGAPRLRESGQLFRDVAGQLSIYGPGHGDVIPCLRGSGTLKWLREQGVDYLLLANIDNLGASLDPALLGHFVAAGTDLQVEVVRKEPGDTGGAPALVNGAMRVIEGFAFPPDFDQQRIDVFNTNTLWFRTAALDQDFDLHAYTVRKQADGQRVVQFERLVGQMSWLLRSNYIEVSRQRFLPVKSPADLNDLQPRLRALFASGLPVLG